MAKANAKEAVARRILVLGSSTHTRLVKSFDWDKLPRQLTVADYDTVILNFAPFSNKDFAQKINPNQLPDMRQFARLVFSKNSEVIAIGSPFFQVGVNPFQYSTWWLPATLHFEHGDGDEIITSDGGFADYMTRVRRWSYYLEAVEPDEGYMLEPYLTAGAPGTNRFEIKLTPVAETRFHRSIAFKLSFYAYSALHGMNQGGILSGDVFWLPEPTETTASDAIDTLLRERYKLRFEKEPPGWAAPYVLPAELPIAEAIKQKETTLSDIRESLKVDYARLTQVQRFKKLLFEQGEDVLEPVVRDTLRALGADVFEPKLRGREDGRLVDPKGRNAMLEIKGRTGVLRLSDVRELDNWVRDAIAAENWQSKGLLIANLQIEQSPGKRRDVIPGNCLTAAANFGLCIVTTTQLYRALLEDQNQQLDQQRFWDVLFETNGMCALPELA